MTYAIRNTPRPLSEAPKDGTWVLGYDHASPPPYSDGGPEWEPVRWDGDDVVDSWANAWVDVHGTELDESEWLFIPMPPAPEVKP